MTTANGVETYCDACCVAFQDRPEVYRIDLYAAHARRDSDNPVHLYRLANACLDGGSIPLWHDGVALALTRPHETARSVDDRRAALRRLGDWSAYQDHPWPTGPDFLPPVVEAWWDGVEDLSGKTLLICLLNAFGDTIRWLRFAETLYDRIPATIYWAVAPSLLEFVEHNLRHLPRMQAFDLTETEDATRTDARFDRALSAELLPQLVGPLPPFIRRAAPAPVTWPERTNHARLGLVWAAQLFNSHLERSVPLGLLMPFFWRPDVEFYSLQVGIRAREDYMYPRLRLPNPPLDSFADTANLVATLDGVVTVDTSVAHLSGSLGVPTLTLLPTPCDVYWGFADTTPWYPTMRLIRQRNPWDWLSVQAQLKEALDSRWWEGTGGSTSLSPVTPSRT
jgi:hypothetical protein